MESIRESDSDKGSDDDLVILVERVKGVDNWEEKRWLIQSHPNVRSFHLQKRGNYKPLLSLKELYLLESVALIGQIDAIFPKKEDLERSLPGILNLLSEIEEHYAPFGGILGYQLKMLSLLKEKKQQQKSIYRDDNLRKKERYLLPHFFYLMQEDEPLYEAIYKGIESLPLMAEIYALGGAADRLHLVDKKTDEELPAAKLPFAGKPLLYHLICDLQAREYLHFKLFGQQVTTPIALMTSEEKKNDFHIRQLCEERGWFGRSKESFFFFLQPLIPVIDEEGNWCKKSEEGLLVKPGGHGAIWMLAKQQGVFNWLSKKGRRKALIRQINNPIAGVDYGILAFLGIGIANEMLFGFASCPKKPDAAEGMNVLIEKECDEGVGYFLSNIEYCDLKRLQGVLGEGKDLPLFTANTNILFVDLNAVEQAVDVTPFPSPLLNFKEVELFEQGSFVKRKIARLETTMQNIADCFVEYHKRPLPLDQCRTQRTYITLHHRERTISTAKKAYKGDSYLETPERCYFDYLKNSYDLLTLANVTLPPYVDFASYIQEGPSLIFTYHPALGPMYSMIVQKIQGGMLSKRSELRLSISEMYWKEVTLSGSLLIEAQQPLGHLSEGILTYSEQVGRCYLENVRIENQGIDWEVYCNQGEYWREEIERKEVVKIEIEGCGEFFAKDVYLFGSHHFLVRDKERMEVFQIGEELIIKRKKITGPSWSWKYEKGNKGISILYRESK